MISPCILTTRFDNTTWQINAIKRKEWKVGCCYGSSSPMPSVVRENHFVFVIEMNNSTNQIQGVGFIINRPASRALYSNAAQDDPVQLAKMADYNRCVYIGKHWMAREQLPTVLVAVLNAILFTGKSHLKRGRGFTQLSNKILSKYSINGEIWTTSHVKTQLERAFKQSLLPPQIPPPSLQLPPRFFDYTEISELYDIPIETDDGLQVLAIFNGNTKQQLSLPPVKLHYYSALYHAYISHNAYLVEFHYRMAAKVYKHVPSMNNLAFYYHTVGQYDEAEQLYWVAFHDGNIETLHNLAHFYREVRQNEEKVREICKIAATYGMYE